MPKIKVTPNRVVIHVGKWWRKYRKEPEEFEAFRIQDVGRPKKSERIAVKLENGKWTLVLADPASGLAFKVEHGVKYFIYIDIEEVKNIGEEAKLIINIDKIEAYTEAP